MKPTWYCLPLSCALLMACSPTSPAPEPASPTTTTAPVATEVPVAEPAPAPSETAPVATMALAGFKGYGDLALGMAEAQASQAWGGELKSLATAQPGSDCHYLTPAWVKTPSDFAFMFEGGRFVRYDVGTDKEAAPGGGKVGMDVAQLHAQYPQGMAAMPHKYVDGAQYLVVESPEPPATRLVFETDASGRVTRWRVGLPPQVDYVEGCS